ncbi:FkbM family methyltransferase [Microcystis wesenbergii]|uniref:FkbM family methyltransferase n=1 Tax=Microcystis wesenbergii NRERC-220 TaxID=3068991 RepID=A0ABU3HPT2_9CHRO|nr:FkbM family methyltransferase [Microcystis wesenbergii]MDT3676189.1 FkbM family methyltransferase [Microcystis wesenbergii NRERC-220]
MNNLLTKLKKYFDFVIKPYKFFIYPKKDFNYHKLCFSQEGEDILLERIFENKTKGFYVDIGSHHPQRFSNTYNLYLKGWSGINIDPMPNSMQKFNQLRKRDTNLELGISSTKKTLNYYIFNETALNGFNKPLSLERDKLENYEIIDIKEIDTFPLSEILNKYLPENKHIDVMSIDVEGLDYQILESNDWDKYRPSIILVEEIEKVDLLSINSSRIASFLIDREYIPYSKLFHTLIFIEKAFKI